MIMGVHTGACPRFKGRMQGQAQQAAQRRGATRAEQDERLTVSREKYVLAPGYGRWDIMMNAAAA